MSSSLALKDKFPNEWAILALFIEGKCLREPNRIIFNQADLPLTGSMIFTSKPCGVRF
jgi:hypothetical protein